MTANSYTRCELSTIEVIGNCLQSMRSYRDETASPITYWEIAVSPKSTDNSTERKYQRKNSLAHYSLINRRITKMKVLSPNSIQPKSNQLSQTLFSLNRLKVLSIRNTITISIWLMVNRKMKNNPQFDWSRRSCKEHDSVWWIPLSQQSILLDFKGKNVQKIDLKIIWDFDNNSKLFENTYEWHV